MTTAVEEKKDARVAPFGIRADGQRNNDILLQSIPNCRLRSTLKANRTVTDARTGEKMVPQDQARHLGQMPEVPGMELHVNPGKCTYMITDPLHKNEELCERIRRRLNQQGAMRMQKVNGVPPQEGTLDVHRMKTLVRELIWLMESGDAELIKGPRPQLDAKGELPLPGHFLLNPGSRVINTQPMFEKDWDDWVTQLTRSGG